MPKKQGQSSRKSDRTLPNPRSLTQRQRTLIVLYSNCPLGMSPQQFYTKWEVTQQELALICSRSISTVQRWFTSGRSRRPSPEDLRHLALMDFLLEHFEEMPKTLFNLLCPH
ncbi:MAG: helix-turn-helix domain-containing protein [Cyanobacteriota bacterium]